MNEPQIKRKLMGQMDKIERDLLEARNTVNRIHSPSLDKLEEEMEKMEDAMQNMKDNLSDVAQEL